MLLLPSDISDKIMKGKVVRPTFNESSPYFEECIVLVNLAEFVLLRDFVENLKFIFSYFPIGHAGKKNQRHVIRLVQLLKS